jgi:hypothetical protein
MVAPVAIGGAEIGVGRGRGRMDPVKLKANIASRQERWQTLQHDPDFDRSYHRYAPRGPDLDGVAYRDNGGYAVPAPVDYGVIGHINQPQYSLFGGGGGYGAGGGYGGPTAVVSHRDMRGLESDMWAPPQFNQQQQQQQQQQQYCSAPRPSD